MKISIAEAKRMLPTGTEFVAEFVGTMNYESPIGRVTRRRVVSASAYEMKTEILDGPKAGTCIYLKWTGLAADRDGRCITISQYKGEAFVKFTFDEKKRAA